MRFNLESIQRVVIRTTSGTRASFVVNVNWNSFNGNWNVNAWNRDNNRWNAENRVFSPETIRILPWQTAREFLFGGLFSSHPLAFQLRKAPQRESCTSCHRALGQASCAKIQRDRS